MPERYVLLAPIVKIIGISNLHSIVYNPLFWGYDKAPVAYKPAFWVLGEDYRNMSDDAAS